MMAADLGRASTLGLRIIVLNLVTIQVGFGVTWEVGSLLAFALWQDAQWGSLWFDGAARCMDEVHDGCSSCCVIDALVTVERRECTGDSLTSDRVGSDRWVMRSKSSDDSW